MMTCLYDDESASISDGMSTINFFKVWTIRPNLTYSQLYGLVLKIRFPDVVACWFFVSDVDFVPTSGWVFCCLLGPKDIFSFWGFV